MKRRTLIIIGVVLLALLGASGAGFYWLCHTDAGLRWLVGQTSRLKSVRFQVEGLEGRLSGTIRIRRLEIVHKRAHVVATGIRAHLQLRNLLVQSVHADALHADDIDVTLKSRVDPPNNRPPRFLPVPWLTVSSDTIDVGRARLTLQNGQVFTSQRVTGESKLSSRRLRLKRIRVTELTLNAGSAGTAAPVQIALAGSGDVRAASPIKLDGEWQWTARLRDQPDYAGRLTLAGDLNILTFMGDLLRPHRAAIDGSARDLIGRWHWTAQLMAAAFDFKPWSPQSTAGTFAVNASARGDRDSLQAQAHIEPQALPTGPLDVSFAGAYANRRLRTDRLDIRFGGPGKHAAQAALGGTVTTAGDILFEGGFPTLRLQGRWAQLRFPANAPTVVSSTGELTLAGQLPYAFTANGVLSSACRAPKCPLFPSAHFSSEGTVDKDQLTVDRFETRFNDKGGPIQGSGELAWSRQNAWSVTLSARQFDPALFNKAFPGAIGFNLSGSGNGFEPTGPWQIKLDSLRGQLRAQPLSGRLQISRNGDAWELGDTRLQYGDARLEASGSYDKTPDLRWAFSAENLSKVWPEAHGKLHSQGNLSGSDAQPRLTASLQGSGLKYQNYRIGTINAETDLDLRDSQARTALDRGRMHLSVTATELGLDTRTIRSLSASLKGTTADHQLQVEADAGNAQLELTARGVYGLPTNLTAQTRGTQPQGTQTRRDARTGVSTRNSPRQWQGVLSRLSLTVGKEQLALEAPAPLTLGTEQVDVPPFCLTGNPQRVCVNARWQPRQPWTGQLKIQSLPLRLFSAGLPPRARYSGDLSIDAQLDAEPQRFTAAVALDRNETAEVTGQATAERNPLDWRRAPLTGSMRGRTRELAFVHTLVPEIDRASGEMSANFNLSGTLGAPQLNGTLSLEKGELDLFAVNLLLRDVGLRLDLEGNTLKLKAQARAGQGSANVEGQMAWQDGAPKGNVTLKGENLLVANVPEARVHASPNITVIVDGRDIQVDGAVRVPYARLAPANLSGAVLSSSDEVLAGSPPGDPAQSFRVTTGVHLILGDDVRIDSYGLSGRLTGSIALYTAPDELSTGTGELRIVENNDNVKGGESKYVAYGRELDIERGRLIFSGGALSDPGVDIRASRRIGEVTAGVNVRGSLRNPRLSFFSDPPLPQTQIASLLVAGRTLDSIQDNATPGGSQTREQLLAQGGALIARQLGSQLGIDDVSVESGVNEDTSLVLGKYLSSRLYVGYGISLAETINTLKLRYTLGDRWTLKMEAGENRSVDIVYAIDR